MGWNTARSNGDGFPDEQCYRARMDQDIDAALAEWERKQLAVERGDPLWGLVAYRMARMALDLVREDLRTAATRTPKETRDQLSTAVASVSANIAEGYSRLTGPDRSRFFAYALGSVREAIVWYTSLCDVLPERALLDRVELLSRIRRITLGMIKATHRPDGGSPFKP
jgi:four helix bundle protein